MLPYEQMDAGKLSVYLFDADALEVARQLADGKGYRLTDRAA